MTVDFGELTLEALTDTLKLLPFLLAALFLMEYLEHRAGNSFSAAMEKAGRFGPLIGAALGCVPQCGFSAASAQLFNSGLITAGTLVAVFLSTSDEAVPILLANPGELKTVGLLILVKVIVALTAGFALDALWKGGDQRREYQKNAQEHVCSSDRHILRILWAAVKRTLSIVLFIFLVTLILSVVMELVGFDRLATGLLPGFFQPFVAALIGFIPNCAASVLLIQLYLEGLITFGSAVAGLCTAAGVGLVILLRGKRQLSTYAIVLGVTYLSAVVFGSLIQWIF